MQPAQMGAFMRVFMRTVAVGSMLLGLSAAAIGPVLAQMQPLPPPQQYPPAGAQAVPPPAPPPGPPMAQPAPQPIQPGSGEFSPNEIVDAGHRFFGGISRGLATIVEKAVSQWGLPNGYILGEEGGGAFFGGLRYGEGMLYTKNAGDLKVFWQGPSVGWDFGGEGARTMMLVYKLPATHAIYQRFGGIDGSAYFIGGLGMTALTANNIVVVPIRSGLGLRLGANIGYLKFTPQPTWNPF
jgi:hypothetical protein